MTMPLNTWMPLLFPFEDAAVNVDRVADLEHLAFFPQIGLLDQVQYLLTHRVLLF